MGAPFKQAGKGPCKVSARAGVQKKLMGERPSAWLKAFTLSRLVSGSSAITRSMRCSANWAMRSLKGPSVQIRRTDTAIDRAGSSSR